MNHPTREDWMSYVYDEVTASERTNLAAHLQTCAECRTNVEEWQSARAGLDAWHLEPARSHNPARPGRFASAGLLKWAAAAALILCAGFAFGRLSAPSVDVAGLRDSIQSQLRQELAQVAREEANRVSESAADETRQVLAEFTDAVVKQRTADNKAIYAALDKLETQRLADYVSLKKDVDTVAVMTDAGLRQAEQQLVQLADYHEPTGASASPKQ